MRDAGWNRGRRREEAHFPVLTLTNRGAWALHGSPIGANAADTTDTEERASNLAMRAMVQGAYGLEDHKHHRIEVAGFVREAPGVHVVMFAMERHPYGQRLMCLYVWHQRTNAVFEVDSIPVCYVRDLDVWFRQRLAEQRQRLGGGDKITQRGRSRR